MRLYWDTEFQGSGGGSHNYKNDRVTSLLLFCKGSKCENLRCKKATISLLECQMENVTRNALTC